MVGFLIYAVTQPMFAWMMKYLFETIQNRTQESVFWLPFVIVSIVFVRGGGSFLGNYFLSKVAFSVIHTLRCEVFNHYTVLPNAYFEEQSAGHLVSSITYNVNQVTTAATEALKIVVKEGATVVGLLIYLLYLNWKLSLVFFAIAPIIVVLVIAASKRFRRISKNIQNSMGDITHVCSELISGFRVVRSFGGEAYEKQRFQDASAYNYQQSLRLTKASAIHTPLLQLIVTIALAVLLALGLMFIDQSRSGDFIAYITAALLLPRSVKQLGDINSKIQNGLAAAESVFEIIDVPPEEDGGSYTCERILGKLSFDSVTFQYPAAEQLALDNVSFVAEPGTSIALVGYSGSGKTTLASLIPRFYDYTGGKILLDDKDIKQFSRTNLRQHISLVTQNVTLFNDTVEKNIAYGQLYGTPRDKVIEAVIAANAMEFIQELPEGLDTLIGENGVKLSGGQRQRLAIARAILKNSPLLILDEATSALDLESERKIQQAMEVVMQGKTTIIIAHRLSTIEKADIIFVMDKGRIKEQGDHQTLLAQNGYYAQLYQSQMLQT